MRYSIKILILAVPLSINFLAKAQTNYLNKAQFSIGIDAGIPTGKLANTYNFMLGGFVQEAIPLAKVLQVTINVSYNKFKGKSNVDEQLQDVPLFDYPDIDLLAAKGGLKYYLLPIVYLQADAGIAVVLNGPQSSYEIAQAFIYSPKIGVALPVSSRSNVDIALRYEATNNFGYSSRGNISSLSIGIAYGF